MAEGQVPRYVQTSRLRSPGTTETPIGEKSIASTATDADDTTNRRRSIGVAAADKDDEAHTAKQSSTITSHNWN